MILQSLNLSALKNLISHQVDPVTCLECCKYYIAPETASCGHSLCHACWRQRRTCPACAAPLDRKSLKLNLLLQNFTQDIQTLAEAFEKLFNINLDEVALEDIENENDPTKNVKEWLASSQNQFSAPIVNSEPFSQGSSEPVEISKSKIDIHVSTKKSISPQKVVYVPPPPQDDWDKIEQLPDTDEIEGLNKENLTSETNKQLCFISEEYTTYNPRRSSRKRDSSNHNDIISVNQDLNTERTSSKLSSSETEKKTSKAKQNWNNVKRMRKEFSKLNKKNRSKLNVSIEMCKKNQSNINKPPEKEIVHKNSQPPPFSIEDNTPDLNKNEINMQDNILRSDLKEPIKDMNNENEPMKQTNNKNESMKQINRENEPMKQVYNENESMKQIINENNHIKKSPDIESEKVINFNSNGKIKQDNFDGQSNLPVNNMCQDTTNDTTNNKSSNTRVPFIKKKDLCPNCSGNNNQSMTEVSKLEDIQITFKVGNSVTNITIKRKTNDVKLIVKADREVQTSLGTNNIVEKNDGKISPNEIEINLGDNKNVCSTNIGSENVKVDNNCDVFKSTSTKKHTASADTATAQFEITESVEKELSNIMECVDGNNENMDVETEIDKIQSQHDLEKRSINENSDKYINDLDIFDNESVQEQTVQSLSKSKYATSEILKPSNRTKSQKHPDKRNREDNEDTVPEAKKLKTNLKGTETTVNVTTDDSLLKPSHKDNDSMNYDAVMGQVFASIDADIEKSQQSVKNKGINNNKSIKNPQHSENIFQSQKTTQIISMSSQTPKLSNRNDCDASIQQHIENLLTPGMCQDLISTNADNMEINNKDQCTPFQGHDDSESVVEETPQKEVSFPKPKNVSDVSIVPKQLQRANSKGSKATSSSQFVKSVIDVSDTLVDTTKTSKDQTVLETLPKKQTLETPLTINKFVDQIKHKSTPMARKSLNFDSENIDDVDPEQTLCPSLAAIKTTQEREFMAKAFEQTPSTPKVTKKSEAELNYCIAGSCLTPPELTNVKILCRKYKWRFMEKYTSELTHLVVGVDEQNKSQRSVKYMCALAASKWIVSYKWVDACIRSNEIVHESLYEALDGTGEPGPTRSRLAKRKVFEGITFFCMPPFSVLDADNLKGMLVAAGGRVADDAKAVRATGDAPALLLAEPEDTQEDKFMYLALELNIVPVNYEWVLNCLGTYSLLPLQPQLMCPAALLPPATARWPPILISRDIDE